MNLQTKLEIEFKIRYIEGFYPPKIIIMHPTTLVKLRNEIFASYSMAMFFNDGKAEYRGVKIYRSLDIEENKFIVR